MAESTTRRYLLRLLIRVLVIVLLSIAIWNPRLPGVRPQADLVLLLDASLSMSEEQLDAGWKLAKELIHSLAPQSTIRILRFAATPVLEYSGVAGDIQVQEMRPPRGEAVDPSTTDLAAALSAGLSQVIAPRSAMLLSISDYRITDGDTEAVLNYARNAGVPVYAIDAGQPHRSLSGAWIVDVQSSRIVGAGIRMPVRIGVAADAPGRYRLRLLEQGAEIFSSLVDFEAGESMQVIDAVIPPVDPGLHRLTLELWAQSTPQWIRLQSIEVPVNVVGDAGILLVTHSPQESTFAALLRARGWEVRTLTPEAFQQWRRHVYQPSAVVLDNISQVDMSDVAWRELVDLVEKQGVGLLVLGGERSFSAGGYRHSRLESILPVISESGRPQDPAAICFVIDSSGSMSQGVGLQSRLKLTAKAAESTLNSIASGDQVSLITFAEQPQTLLELTLATEANVAFESLASLQAGGGTRLLPALQLAIEQLRSTAIQQRLLVLLTDGFTESEIPEDLIRTLENEGIRVIAIAVGDQPGLANLTPLTRVNEGQLLRVSSSAELPGIMQQELAQQRAAIQTGPVKPRQLRPFPSLQEQFPDWPQLDGYVVTRKSGQAQVLLTSDAGDPLMAVQQAGSGRVVAMPAGISESWNASWLNWPYLTTFLDQMFKYLSGFSGPAGIDLQVKSDTYRLLYDVELSDLDADRAVMTVVDPSSVIHRVELEAIAPGHMRAQLPTNQPGIYQATLDVDGRRLQLASLHNPLREQSPSLSSRYDEWVNSGLIRPWPGNQAAINELPGAALHARYPFLILTAVVYLAGLFLDTFGIRLLKHLPGGRIAGLARKQ